MNRVISAESLMSTFPTALSADENQAALAKIAASELVKLYQNNRLLNIFGNIDTLSEKLLDILAYDLYIQWYDYSYSVEEKRKVVKEVFEVYRLMGTKYAVETALRSIYPDSHVREWYEYGGEPYHFMIEISDSANDREKCNRVLQKVRFCKNARSVMDETVYTAGSNIGTTVYCGVKVVGVTTDISCKAEIYV